MALYQKISFLYLIIVNVLAYLCMCWDKLQARQKGFRIAENTLWLLAMVGGSLGIYLGMKPPLYHKAGKAKFVWGIPLILCFQILGVFFLIIEAHPV